MLTVKLVSPSGSEEIHCGFNIGFDPINQSITISGMEQKIILKDGDVAYVMNATGKTISRYEYKATLSGAICGGGGGVASAVARNFKFK